VDFSGIIMPKAPLISCSITQFEERRQKQQLSVLFCGKYYMLLTLIFKKMRNYRYERVLMMVYNTQNFLLGFWALSILWYSKS
jgi:hypothetical protein